MFRLMTLAILLTAAAGMATAQVPPDGDFDIHPEGPWSGDVLEGDPGCVQIVDTANGGTGGAGLPPGASGKMLCVDARNKNQRIVIRLGYNCMPGDPTGVCKISYSYSGAVWVFGGGVGTYVNDDGSYDNPDDLWQPPVGFPPSTTFGTNSENEQGCANNHTIDFVVEPGTIWYLDNVGTECLAPVANEQHSFGALKGHFE